MTHGSIRSRARGGEVSVAAQRADRRARRHRDRSDQRPHRGSSRVLQIRGRVRRHERLAGGGAIENARLYDETRARVRELEAITELGEVIAGAGKIDELLPEVAGRSRGLLQARACRLYLLEPGREELVLCASSPEDSDARTILRLAELGPELARGGRASRVAVPLGAGDELLGLLVAEYSAALELARAVGSQVAVGIKRIQLIERLAGETGSRTSSMTLRPVETAGCSRVAERTWLRSRSAARRARRRACRRSFRAGALRSLSGSLFESFVGRLGGEHEMRQPEIATQLRSATLDDTRFARTQGHRRSP